MRIDNKITNLSRVAQTLHVYSQGGLAFSIGDKMRKIKLTQGKFALVDADDYIELSGHKWCTSKSRCGDLTAVRRKSSAIVRMHREIMKAPKGMVVDHINHNTLDNRRCNLRLCTISQNNRNQHPRGGSSMFKGVCFYKRDDKWQAYIRLDGKRHHLGYFSNEISAAEAYDAKAKELFGEFAYLNFPARRRNA